MPEKQLEFRHPHRQNPYLYPHLRSLPFFRSLLRAVEASFYADIDLPHPILDVGSGDGHFASLSFSNKIDVGIDPWGALMAEAKSYGAYLSLVVADGASMPFPTGHFASAMSNSVLEHIPQLDAVLSEIGRVLSSGATFVFCVPNHHWRQGLAVPPALRKIGLSRLANVYADWFVRITRHYHMLDPEEWRERLDRAGFELVQWWHYFPPQALAVLEWGHYLGLPSLLTRKLFGRWILAPTKWNLSLTEQLLQPYAGNEKTALGTYSFFLARRR